MPSQTELQSRNPQVMSGESATIGQTSAEPMIRCSKRNPIPLTVCGSSQITLYLPHRFQHCSGTSRRREVKRSLSRSAAAARPGLCVVNGRSAILCQLIKGSDSSLLAGRRNGIAPYLCAWTGQIAFAI